MNTRIGIGGNRFVYLTSSNWSYDREDRTAAINCGERIIAFKDKTTNSICVKFIFG